MICLDAFPCKNLVSFATTIATITSDNDKELEDAISKLNKSGGIIYIDTPIIHVSSKSPLKILSGSIEGGIIDKQQPDGSYPVIEFTHAVSTNSRLEISCSNQFLKYLIIQNSWKGIWLTGSKNTLEHIYNFDSGFQISDNAISNTLNYCYSYRNINFPNFGANDSGFFLKPDSSQTVFNYCFSFDNSNKWWDVNDKEGDSSVCVSYLHSACWNNDNPDVFTGKYDYDNNRHFR